MIASLIIPNPTLISCCLLHVFKHFIRKWIFFFSNFFLCVFRGCMISFFSVLFCPNYFQLFLLFFHNHHHQTLGVDFWNYLSSKTIFDCLRFHSNIFDLLPFARWNDTFNCYYCIYWEIFSNFWHTLISIKHLMVLGSVNAGKRYKWKACMEEEYLVLWYYINCISQIFWLAYVQFSRQKTIILCKLSITLN